MHPRLAWGQRGVAVVAVALSCGMTGCFVIGGVIGGAAVGVAAAHGVSPDSVEKTVDGIPVGAAISVRLAPSRDVIGLIGGASDSTSLRNVRTLIGRIDAIQGDTIRLAVSEARLRNGRTDRFRAPLMTIFQRGPEARIQVISREPTVGGFATLLGWLGFVVALMTLGPCC